MKPHTTQEPTRWVRGVDDQVLEVTGHCGLYIDLAPDAPAPIPGDWVATEAGSRYLIHTSRLVRSRRHAQLKRYQLRIGRLPKHAEPPADVHVLWLRWYPRASSSRPNPGRNPS